MSIAFQIWQTFRTPCLWGMNSPGSAEKHCRQVLLTWQHLSWESPTNPNILSEDEISKSTFKWTSANMCKFSPGFMASWRNMQEMEPLGRNEEEGDKPRLSAGERWFCMEQLPFYSTKSRNSFYETGDLEGWRVQLSWLSFSKQMVTDSGTSYAS